MKKKRIVTMLMAVLLIILCIPAGCGKKEESDQDLLARIKEKGEIVIAMEGTWAPWTYHDENDKLVGFDTEVGEAIAEILGVKAVFVEGEWDGLLAGLEVGRYDLMINGVEITDDRSEKYDFTDAYAYIRTALIVKSDNNEITTFEDLKGKTTANSINSTYMYLAEDYGATVLGVDTLDQTLDMVLSGRADATLNAELSFDDYMKVHPDVALKVAALTEEASLVAIPVRKGEDGQTLREAVNNAIKELRGNGKLAEISEKYFGKDITQP
ncbi:MAG: transporter substrate-binding domain-containing protein [Lachnospiraceae bacterium]|nr:transporter substrate-binding domain-containing protein [Lachnospiraceae bacterium]